MHHALRAACLIALLALTGCAGNVAPQPAINPQLPQRFDLSQLPAPQPGVQMPVADPVEIEFDTADDKATSAVYRILFRDAVNEQSAGRWDVSDQGLGKDWVLSNTYFSAPKAWVIGQNYWNRENDSIFSRTTIFQQSGEDGFAVTFRARWKIAAGDFGTVYWFGTPNGMQLVTAFGGGSNPSYPGWDKYYFKLPRNTESHTIFNSLIVHFYSNSTGTDWGFGIDDIAVYQTQLGTPLNLAASDETTPGAVELSWAHNNTGKLAPDGYEVYRALDEDGAPGEFLSMGTVPYPEATYTDTTSNGRVHWYRVVAIKDGWPDSPASNFDAGHGIGTWRTVTVASDAVTTSLIALANGHPAIAYVNQGVYFAYCNLPDGSNDWVGGRLVEDDLPSSPVSAALVDGRPAVAYNSQGDLRYAFSAQPNGDSDWTSITVDALDDGRVRYGGSLSVVSGKPAIGYHLAASTIPGEVRYAYSSTADGSSGWNEVTVDAVQAGHVALADLGGFPAISYSHTLFLSNTTLRYAYSTQPNGSGGWNTVVVDANGGGYSSLRLINGAPAIAYFTGSPPGFPSFYYAYSSQPDGSSGWATTVVSTLTDDGRYCSLGSMYGKPAIACYRTFGGDLALARSTKPDGSSGWSSATLDTAGGVGTHCSFATINGMPAISYIDFMNGALKYAWLE